MVMCFTHDIVMDTMLPGVAPTGRYVELPVVVAVGFADGRVVEERIYWDQAAPLVQVGLLDPALLPVTGTAQSRRLRGQPQTMLWRTRADRHRRRAGTRLVTSSGASAIRR